MYLEKVVQPEVYAADFQGLLKCIITDKEMLIWLKILILLPLPVSHLHYIK